MKLANVLTTLAVVAVVALTGCGGSKAAATHDSAALRASVEGYSAAYLSGDGAGAWRLLSSRCRTRISEGEMLRMTPLAAKMYGDQSIETLKIVSLSGNMARVTYTFQKAELTQSRQPWVKEGGQWLKDNC